MINLIILLSAGSVLGQTIGIIIALPVILVLTSYLFLAPNDILFSFSIQNRVKYITEANGNTWTGDIIFYSDIYYIEPKTYNVREITNTTSPTLLMKKWNLFGMYWVGIPPMRSIYKYELTWQEWRQVGLIYELYPRKEITPFLLVQRTAYGMYLKEAENIEGYPLNIGFVVYLRATNIRKPIWDNDNAFGQLQGLLLGEAALYVKNATFKHLFSLKSEKIEFDKAEHDDFSKAIYELNDSIGGESEKQGVIEKFGFKIEGAKIITVEIAGGKKEEINNATIEVGIAEQNKQVKILEAEGEAKSMDLITEAKEKRFKLFKDNPGAVAVEVAEKTFEKSNLTTYVTGNNAVPVVPVK
ncbi:MAG: hypothetical protein KGI58_03495 [Patescibacteria group bacterium]|nr:hypothetical protein [Patescibacteria group bacterium]